MLVQIIALRIVYFFGTLASHSQMIWGAVLIRSHLLLLLLLLLYDTLAVNASFQATSIIWRSALTALVCRAHHLQFQTFLCRIFFILLIQTSLMKLYDSQLHGILDLFLAVQLQYQIFILKFNLKGRTEQFLCLFHI